MAELGTCLPLSRCLPAVRGLTRAVGCSLCVMPQEPVPLNLKKASKAELKKVKKRVAERREQGIEVYTDEELENAGFLPDV